MGGGLTTTKIENNIASDIRLSRNVVNKESKSSRRFVRICNTKRSDTTLRQQLTRPKDPIPPHRRDGIVYNIPCEGCDRSYIGETARPIKERITEHKRDVRLRRTDNSAVAEHAWDNQHQPDWDGVQCLSQERHWYTRRVKEAINIRLNPNNFNRDNGIDIPKFWMRTIRRHDTRRPASQHQSIPFSRQSEPAAR